MRWDGQAGLYVLWPCWVALLQVARRGCSGLLLAGLCTIAATHMVPRLHAAAAAGSQTLQGEAVGFETEATAIMDTMAYIRPDIYTLVG